MPIPNDIEIQFDGITLNSTRWNIETIPEGIPARRGDNITIPFRDGARYIRKPYEQRSETLNMWVRAVDENGVLPSGVTPRRQLETNIEYLKQLFGIEGLVAYRKKMRDGSWRKANVEVANAVEFQRSQHHAVFSVELRFPDPYFYAESATRIEEEISTNPQTVTFNNPGTAYNRKAEITITGAAVNLKIENTTTKIWVKYNGTTVAGDEIVIDCENFTCKVNGQNAINLISHQGDPAFMVLAPGENTLKISADETPDVTLEVEAYAAYH